jgi:hypothetical protein
MKCKIISAVRLERVQWRSSDIISDKKFINKEVIVCLK